MTDQTGVDDPEWEVLPVVGDSAPVGARPLLLTQGEMADLVVILMHYRDHWGWANDPDDLRASSYVVPIRRKLALAERIIEANR